MTNSKNKRRIICVSQARMTSTRLPGKVLMPVLGEPLLYYHLSRLQRSKLIDQLVVATTVNATDDPIDRYCRSLGVPVFRGDEADVLSRYDGAVKELGEGADVVIRVTSDCPLIDPEVVDDLAAMFINANPALDYAAIDGTRFPHGLDAEIFRRACLEEAMSKAIDPAEREHVTPYIYRRPGRFICGSHTMQEDHHDNRWCVDEPADLTLVSKIIEELYPENPNFGWRDCVRILDDNPAWRALNAKVEQKQSADLLLRSGAKTD